MGMDSERCGRQRLGCGQGRRGVGIAQSHEALAEPLISRLRLGSVELKFEVLFPTTAAATKEPEILSSSPKAMSVEPIESLGIEYLSSYP